MAPENPFPIPLNEPEMFTANPAWQQFLREDPLRLRQATARLLIESVRLDGYLRFAVADQGLGIPPGERRRVFEKFYRLDPDMTRGIGGTGLGLYICRELVRRVSGRIWVEPNDERGSIFYVEIPFAAPAAAGEKAREAAAAQV